MKRITQNLFIALLASAVLFSCGKDEEPTAAKPSVSLTATVDGNTINSGAQVVLGDTITFTASITAPGGVNTLWLGTEAISRADLGVDAGATSATFTFTVDVSEVGTLALEVYAVDDLNQQSETVTFTVEAISPEAKVQTMIVLLAPDADGTKKAFYSVGQNQLYSHNDVVGTTETVSDKIDFAYYYGNTDEASLVSPSEYPSAVFDISSWTTRNETAMIQVVGFTEEEWMALKTVKDVEDLLESVSNETAVLGYTGLEVGTVIAFETAGEIAGLLRVQDITTGFSGSIELEFILAQPAE